MITDGMQRLWIGSVVLIAACGRPAAGPTPVPTQTPIPVVSPVDVTVSSIFIEEGDYRRYSVSLRAVEKAGVGITLGAADITISTATQSITQRFDRPFPARIPPSGSMAATKLVLVDQADAVVGATTLSARVAYVDDAQQAGVVTLTLGVPTCTTSYSIAAPQIIDVGQVVDVRARQYNGCTPGTGLYDMSPSSSTWEALSPECATLSRESWMMLTGVGHCLATIRSTTNGLPATRRIMVGSLDGPPASLSLDGKGAMPPGGGLTMSVWGTWPNGISKSVTADAEWSSSNPVVASVNGGRVIGIAEGNATITASYRGMTISRGVAVSATPEAISISGPAYGVPVGSTYGLSATALWASNDSLSVRTLASWSTSDSRIATVSSTGVVTGINPGTVTITAQYLGVTGSRSVAILP